MLVSVNIIPSRCASSFTCSEVDQILTRSSVQLYLPSIQYVVILKRNTLQRSTSVEITSELSHTHRNNSDPAKIYFITSMTWNALNRIGCITLPYSLPAGYTGGNAFHYEELRGITYGMSQKEFDARNDAYQAAKRNKLVYRSGPVDQQHMKDWQERVTSIPGYAPFNLRTIL